MRPYGKGGTWNKELLISAEFAEAVIADAEVMGDFMQDNAPHFGDNPGIAFAHRLDGALEDSDDIRHHEAVTMSAFGEGNAFERPSRVSPRLRSAFESCLSVGRSATTMSMLSSLSRNSSGRPSTARATSISKRSVSIRCFIQSGEFEFHAVAGGDDPHPRFLGKVGGDKPGSRLPDVHAEMS